jgi:hypothetical protein
MPSGNTASPGTTYSEIMASNLHQRRKRSLVSVPPLAERAKLVGVLDRSSASSAATTNFDTPPSRREPGGAFDSAPARRIRAPPAGSSAGPATPSSTRRPRSCVNRPNKQDSLPPAPVVRRAHPRLANRGGGGDRCAAHKLTHCASDPKAPPLTSLPQWYGRPGPTVPAAWRHVQPAKRKAAPSWRSMGGRCAAAVDGFASPGASVGGAGAPLHPRSRKTATRRTVCAVRGLGRRGWQRQAMAPPATSVTRRAHSSWRALRGTGRSSPGRKVGRRPPALDSSQGAAP